MTEAEARHRIQTPDLLRGLAVLFMIQVHIMELFAATEVLKSPVGVFSLLLGGVPAAPVFMIIMGYFIGYRHKHPSNLAKRGLKLLLAGMLLNLGLNAYLIYNVLFEGWGATVNIWHYLFGVDILHLAGLTLLVMALFLFFFRDRILPWLLLLLAVGLAATLLPPHPGGGSLVSYAMAFLHSSAGWSYFPLIPWLAYPLAGYLFLLLEQKYKEQLGGLPFKLAVALALTIFLGFTMQYASGIMRDLPAYYHHGPGFILWALAFTAWWSVLASFAEKYTGRTGVAQYIKWLGMHVTTVYVFQWLLIGNIGTAVYKSLSLYSCVVWFAVILIFTSLLTLTWNKLKREYPQTFPAV